MKGKFTEPEKEAYIEALKVVNEVENRKLPSYYNDKEIVIINDPHPILIPDDTSLISPHDDTPSINVDTPVEILEQEPVYVRNIKKFIASYGWVFMLLGFAITLVKAIQIISSIVGNGGSKGSSGKVD